MMHPFLRRIESGSVPRVADFVEALGEEVALLAKLEETPQDREWHGEGNVRVHTDLVLGEIEDLLRPGGAAAHLDDRRRRILVLAGLFHDLGKVGTTREREIEGRSRVISPGHPAKGRSWLALHHHPLGLPLEDCEELLALVGHHHDPRRLVAQGAPGPAYRKLARLCDLELVYLLELADVRGRIAPEPERELEMLELFRLEAMEQEVWGRRDPWEDWRTTIEASLGGKHPALRRLAVAEGIRQAEAGRIFTPEEAVARAYGLDRHASRPSELVVLCGPSGSGKSTWAIEHLPAHGVVSLDRWRERLAGARSRHHRKGRVLQAARDELRSLLREGRAAVWDATNLRKDIREPLIRLAHDYGAWVEIVCVSTPLEEIRRRNRRREGGVPESVLQRQIDRCEWPFASQAHRMRTVPGTGDREG